jgi:hypothetical protein
MSRPTGREQRLGRAYRKGSELPDGRDVEGTELAAVLTDCARQATALGGEAGDW